MRKSIHMQTTNIQSRSLVAIAAFRWLVVPAAMLSLLFTANVAVAQVAEASASSGVRAASESDQPDAGAQARGKQKSVKRLTEEDLGTHGIAMSGDVKIHYVTAGTGPLVVMIHGFPDYWYSWRHQMPELSKHFQVVAIDQRGYNESGQPSGVEQYTMDKLVGDVRAVVDHFKQSKAIIVGHDWGGMVAWNFAMTHPDMTDRLIVLNLPHPNGLMRELVNNPEQQENSEYARFFQTEGAASKMSPEALALWVTEPKAKRMYIEAFRRSNIDAMLNYYKANYPRAPYRMPDQALPRVQCPVLLIHGLKDKYLLSGALNETWNWIDNELTLVTIPNADHFVQHDAAESVTQAIDSWLQKKR